MAGEGDAAGEQHRLFPFIPGAVLVVAHQGEAPGGELDPDLMAPSGMEPHMNEAGFSRRQTGKFQPGFFYSGTLALDCENLILLAVFPEEVLPVPFFRGRSMNHGHIFLDHGALLYSLGQGSGRLLCSGEDHDTAHIFIQPVNGENFTAQDFLQCSGNFHF